MATVRGMTPEAIRALLKKEIGDYQALSIAVNSAKGASESAIAEVGKIRNDLENMNFDFEFDDSKLNAAMEQFDKDMEALNNSLDEVKTEALARENKLTALEQALNQDRTKFNNEMLEMAKELSDSKEQLQTSMDETSKKLNDNVTDLVNNLGEEFEGGFDSLRTMFDNTLSSFQSNMRREFDGNLEYVLGEVQSLEEKQDAKTKELSKSLGKDLAKLNSDLTDAFGNDLKSLESRQNSKTDALGKDLKNYQSKTDSKVSTLLSELDKAKAYADGFMQPGNLVWNPMALDNARDITSNNNNVSVKYEENTGRPSGTGVKLTKTGISTSYVSYGGPKYATFDAAKGNWFQLSAWVKSSVDLPAGALGILTESLAPIYAPEIPANTWTKLSGEGTPRYKISGEFDYFQVYLTQRFPSGDTVIISDPHAVQKVTSDLIVDGAVVAGKIATDAVEARNIVSGAVTAGKIAADAVTANNIAAGAVLAGKIGANAVTANNIAAGAVTAGKIDVDAVDANNIKSGAITAGKIATDAVLARNIAADTIGAKHIMAKAIGTDQLAANAVTAEKIKGKSIDASKIVAGSIGANELTSNAVTADKLAAKAVTSDKIDANAVTAQKIASKAINGDHIQANSIDATKLTIMPGNLFPDPHFQDPTWGKSGTSYAHKNNGGEFRMFPNGKQVGTYYQPEGIGDGALMLEPGASYRITMNVYGGSQIPEGSKFLVYLKYRNSSGRYVPSGRVEVPVTGGAASVESAIFTAPDNASSSLYTIGFFAFFDGNGGMISIWDVQLTRAADASLIVKGGVQADHIASGAITTDHMSANSIDGDRIKSNTLDADKIRAKSLTSDHVTFKNGFIKNAMIGNAQITSSKIKELDAGKIKTGTLDANRIGANSIDSAKIAAGSIDSSHIKADSITVKELHAGTVVPLGASLIYSEPRTSGAVPEPIWHTVFNSELGDKEGGFYRPQGYPWRTNSSARGKNVQAFIPKRLVKVQPGKKYRVRFWARATAANSQLFMALKSQDGSDAVATGRVESGSYVDESYGTWDGWTGMRQDHSKNPKGGFLLWRFEVPTRDTLVETLITFKPDVEYVYLEEVTFNHGWGKGTANQYIAGLAIDLDVVSQEEVDAVQTKQIDDNKARINDIEALQKKQAKDNQARIDGIEDVQKRQERDNRARMQDNRNRIDEIKSAQGAAQRAIDAEEKFRMRFGSGVNSTTYFSPNGNNYVEVGTLSSTLSPTNNVTRARLKRYCSGYIVLIQNMENGAVDMQAWNVNNGAYHDTFDVVGGFGQTVRKWLLMYQLYPS